MRKIVIKLGTSTLTAGTQSLSRRDMLGLVQQIAHLQAKGLQVVLVSSGAVATGRCLLNASDGSAPKQTCASIGQVRLMQVWAELFALFDLQVGQILVTKEDFLKCSPSSLQGTVDHLLDLCIIPIFNENDTVATEEKRIGDNDNLAALVAQAVSADTLILLTDQEGLYTADPRYISDAELIDVVAHIDEALFALAGKESTPLGTGGMVTKIEAAKYAAQCGIRTIIASALRPNVLIDLVEGRRVGTLFLEQ